MKLRLAPVLRPLPDLDAHEVAASQLASNGMDDSPLYRSDYIGRVVAVRRGDALIAGPLRSVVDSTTFPLLILQIGEFRTAVHPVHAVVVAPVGCRLTVSASVSPDPGQDARNE